jgi:2-oxoglutarate dehydrogenase complex dehydrogenase (E1) component-like enzyme
MTLSLYSWKHWKKSPDHHWKEIFKKRLKTETKIEKVLEKLGKDCGTKADVSYKEYKELAYLVNDADYAGYLNCTLEEYIYGDPR